MVLPGLKDRDDRIGRAADALHCFIHVFQVNAHDEKSECRNPKAEGNPKSECRSPKAQLLTLRRTVATRAVLSRDSESEPGKGAVWMSRTGLRISAFGFPSAFGFLVSDFMVVRPSAPAPYQIGRAHV